MEIYLYYFILFINAIQVYYFKDNTSIAAGLLKSQVEI